MNGRRPASFAGRRRATGKAIPMSGRKLLVEERIAGILLCVMVLMVSMQVVSRYVFHSSFSHTEELVRYFFVWITFLGAGAAAYRKRHISVAGAFRFVPERVAGLAGTVAGFGAVVFGGILVVYGVRVLVLQIRTGQTTAALGLPMWIIGAAVPVCSALLVVRVGMRALGKRRDEEWSGCRE